MGLMRSARAGSPDAFECTVIGATVNEVNHNCQVEISGQTGESPIKTPKNPKIANHKSKLERQNDSEYSEIRT
jgi:hypothetical protein